MLLLLLQRERSKVSVDTHRSYNTGLYCELHSARQRSINTVFYPHVGSLKSKNNSITRKMSDTGAKNDLGL